MILSSKSVGVSISQGLCLFFEIYGVSLLTERQLLAKPKHHGTLGQVEEQRLQVLALRLEREHKRTNILTTIGLRPKDSFLTVHQAGEDLDRRDSDKCKV